MKSLDNATFINRKGKVRSNDSSYISYFVCNRSKESSRGKLGNRLERPVRQNNSLKLDFNCLALVTSVQFANGSMDVEILGFHHIPLNSVYVFWKYQLSCLVWNFANDYTLHIPVHPSLFLQQNSFQLLQAED
jgi:hypothetical protein